MRFMLSIFAFLLFCFLSPVYPHAILQTPTARTGQAQGIGRKVPQPEGPSAMQLMGCGPPQDGIAGADPGPGAIRATYTAGQQVTVRWKITIGHPSDPGVRVAIKYSNTDSFDRNVLASNVNVEANLQGDIASTTITLPAGKSSQNAVLQWIWHSIDDGGYYIACSDIRINAANGGGGATTTAPVTTPTPIRTTAAPGASTTLATTQPGGAGTTTAATTADPDAETTETPETTENPEPTETTQAPDNGNGGGGVEEETTTTRRPTGSTTRTTTRTTTRKGTTWRPPAGQQQQRASGASANQNTAIAFMIASVMAAFFRLFH